MIDLPSNEQPWHVLLGRICPYCGEATTYCDSAVIYGRSYGMIYRCEPCQAWVGVHKKHPKNALGRLANRELRKWKQAAHAHFDPLWKMSIRKHARINAYCWLGQQMGLEEARTHIGMFNVEQCKNVVKLCRKLLGKNASLVK